MADAIGSGGLRKGGEKRKIHLLLHRTTCISLTFKPCCLIL